MSGMPGRQDGNNLIPMALSFGPAVFSAVFAFITKPTAEKTKTDALRKSLLETLRFKMAVEVAACLPVKKKKTPDDDYLEMCRSSLNNYFSANSPVIVDFLDSERVYRSYVRYFKVFKYAIVVIPIFAILGGIIETVATIQSFFDVFWFKMPIFQHSNLNLCWRLSKCLDQVNM